MFKTDEDVILFIDSLDTGSILQYSINYAMKNLNHYLTLQSKWMEEERYLLGTVINHNPSEIELLDAWETHYNAERFRAFYVLRYPENVEKIRNN
jgi:hypothetical protein